MLRYLIFLLTFCCLKVAAGEPEDWNIIVSIQRDSLFISLIAKDSKQQLAVLMQGLQVEIVEQGLTLAFPSASMVRGKMKHHPNEVKAMMRKDSANAEVKPDLYPLIVALCDTTAIVYDVADSVNQPMRDFAIKIDKEHTWLVFSAKISIKNRSMMTDSLGVVVRSSPGALSHRKEFTGKRLSTEEEPIRQGLGHASMGADDANRTIDIDRRVAITRRQDEKE